MPGGSPGGTEPVVRCPRGHVVVGSWEFCPRCGRPLRPPPDERLLAAPPPWERLSPARLRLARRAITLALSAIAVSLVVSLFVGWLGRRPIPASGEVQAYVTRVRPVASDLLEDWKELEQTAAERTTSDEEHFTETTAALEEQLMEVREVPEDVRSAHRKLVSVVDSLKRLRSARAGSLEATALATRARGDLVQAVHHLNRYKPARAGISPL